MTKTKIQWATEVWNPVRGCSRVSEGCRFCYAEKMAARFCGPGLPYEGVARMTRQGARWTGDVMVVRDKLEDPLHWRKPRRVFVNSMSDLFHEKVPYDFIRDVFGVMAMCRRHTFMILTKRGIDMENWFVSTEAAAAREYAHSLGVDWPLPNVWLGVSVEDQPAADQRLPSLLSTPAAVRFVSAEPLLARVDLSLIPCPMYHNGMPPEPGECGMCQTEFEPERCANGYFSALKEGIDWVIVGCETGPRTQVRAMDVDWVRDLRNQCSRSDTAFFYKQAKDENGKTVSLPVLDGIQHIEWPG